MYFPFDVQTCHMKFGSWTYDGSKIDLDFVFNISSGFEMGEYVKSNEWEIVTSSAKKNELLASLRAFHLHYKEQRTSWCSKLYITRETYTIHNKNIFI
jgi:hypothetical protein